MDEISYENHIITCRYMSDSHAALERHVFSVILSLPVTYLLLYNRNLRRFYTPLARLVNLSIFLNLACAILFYLYYPYDKSKGNCTEIFLNRLYTIVIIFGELHQVYVIAMSLGLGDIKINIKPFVPFGLVKMLNFAFIAMLLSVFGSFFFANYVFLDLVEDGCTVLVSLMQIYIVRVAKKTTCNPGAVVMGSDSAVAIFEQLTFAQLITTMFCVGHRVGSDIMGLDILGDLNAVMLNIDTFCIFLFYTKTLIIKEKTNVIVLP